MSLLEVAHLSVDVPSDSASARIVDDVSFTLDRGRTLGLVGESGSGKSLTARAILRILGGARIGAGSSIRLDGVELTELSERRMRAIRGKSIAMVFQEPMTALDPAYTVGEQIAETIRTHLGLNRRDAWKRAVELLDRVQIPSAQDRARDYPHNFSGGMRQRVVIAMALSCGPQVLLADEPTTALDVTTQSQILALLRDLQAEEDIAMLFISHDLAVIADIADDVCVMYAGQIVERADVYELFATPHHPYTDALAGCVPGPPGARLRTIPGLVPDFSRLPDGCRFAARCTFATDACTTVPIGLSGAGGRSEVRCIHPLHMAEGTAVA